MTRQEARVFLNWQCGCGDPAASVRLIYDVLAAINRRCERSQDLDLFNQAHKAALDAIWREESAALDALLPSRGIYYFVLYMLDHWDLLEHGTAIGGAWMSDKGKALLAVLEDDRADDFALLCASSCIHGYAELENEEDCPECAALG